MGNEEENNLNVVNQNEVAPTTDENTVTQTAEENVEGANIATNADNTNVSEFANKETAKEKMFTQEQVNKIVQERVRRAKNDDEAKYRELQNVLNAGLGTNSVEESTEKLKQFYKEQGVNIPELPQYDERDVETLAKSDASRIIDCGYDEIVDVVDQLASKGVDKMTTREKYLFRELANERKNQEAIKELKSIGVGDEILTDSDFKDFANKFDPSRTTTKEIYEMYKKMLPPKEAPKPIASMKNSDSSADVIKDFYTKDEASKFTRADFDKNPKLFKAVCDSMSRW
ncbi:MAG: hypothetical protein ACLVAK_01610 [Clostridia bacterium]